MELTDIDKKFLEEFCNHGEMFEAVKKAFMVTVFESDVINPRTVEYGRKILPTLNNEEVGANLRARVTAIDALEVVFSQLASEYKRQPKLLTPYNKAR